MARSSPRQRKTTGRVMHEFKHGELKSGRGGKGGKVKSRKQAIAIAMHEAGTSKYDSASKRRKSAATSRRKEATGRTGQQEREGKSHLGARGKRESSRAMGGENATKTTRRKKSSSRGRTKSRAGTRSNTSSRTKSRSSSRPGARSKSRSTSRRTTRRTAAKRRTTKSRRSKR